MSIKEVVSPVILSLLLLFPSISEAQWAPFPDEGDFFKPYPENSLFVRVPSHAGGVLGGVTGLAIGLPVGVLVVAPMLAVQEEEFSSALKYAGLGTLEATGGGGMVGYGIVSHIVGAPFALIEKQLRQMFKGN